MRTTTSSSPSRRLLESTIFGMDRWLQRRQGVYEFSSDSHCLFRVNRTEAGTKCVLQDGTRIERGAPILNLHLWNEHMLRMRPGNSSLGWARRVRRAADKSLRELAITLARRPELGNIRALRADMRLGTGAKHRQLYRIALHLGFEPVAAQSSSQGLRYFGENIHIMLLVLAANPTALRADVLWRDRALFYLSRASLARRYGIVHQPERKDAA